MARSILIQKEERLCQRWSTSLETRDGSSPETEGRMSEGGIPNTVGPSRGGEEPETEGRTSEGGSSAGTGEGDDDGTEF